MTRNCMFGIICMILIVCSCSSVRKAIEYNPTLLSKHPHALRNGFLIKSSYMSTNLRHNGKSMYIYLPPTYYKSMSNAYPVIYFLHGANGNESSWIEKGDILQTIDSLYSSGSIRECIYVFPNMNVYHNSSGGLLSREINSVDAYFGLNGSVESTFIHDVVNFIDTHYKTLTDKNHRAICGLSIGGLQCIYISANNPEHFGHIGLFSPLIYPPLNIGRHSSVYKNLEKKLSVQFNSQPPNYMIMIGEDDIYLKGAYIYSSYLYDQGYRICYQETSGGHTWNNWKDYSIIFLKSLWPPVDTIASEDI